MIRLADVRRWETAQVEEALRLLGKAQQGLVAAEFDLDRTVPPGWVGPAG